MRSAAEAVWTAWNRGLEPPPNESVWEWMDANMVLSGDASESGPYRSSRTPYVRGIAECLTPSHPAREISVRKGSQLGLTTLGRGWLGFIIDRHPTSTLITLPSEGVAKEWSNQRLGDLVDQTPCLKGKIRDSREKGSGNGVFWKRIEGTGAFLKIAWSSSAKKLRSTPAANLLSDEVDGFDRDVEGEGSALALLDRRNTTFPRGKHLKISTPAEYPSLIDDEFRKGDQRYYFVPCPECGHFQVLVFGQLKFEAGPETAAYQCVACEERIAERFKTQMLERGLWVATRGNQDLVQHGFPGTAAAELGPVFEQMARERVVSFHLSALYSPLGWESWEQIARKWIEWHKDPRTLKTFCNVILAEAWVERGEAPEWEELYARRHQEWEPGEFPAPREVLFQVAGVDVQQDRIELERVGYGRRWRSWSLDYKVFRGNTATDTPWIELGEYIAQEFPHETGKKQPLIAIAIDSGHASSQVYRFARRYPQAAYGPKGARVYKPQTVLATKGGYSLDKIIENVSSEDAAKKRYGMRIFLLGTRRLKQELSDWLKAKPYELNGDVVMPAGYCEFPNYEPWIFQGYCSESRVVREKRIDWVKDPAFRNEPLDCRNGARAAAEIYAGRFGEHHWQTLEQELGVTAVRETLPAIDKGAPAQVAATPQQDATQSQERGPGLRIPRGGPGRRDWFEVRGDWLDGRGGDWFRR